MQVLMILSILLLNTIAAAAGGGGHHDQGIPTGMLISQAINLGLLIAIIYFAAGKAIGGFFRSKKEEFLANVEMATKAVSDAKKRKEEISSLYAKLKANYDKDLQDASSKAQDSYRMQVADAKNQAEKMKSDTENALSGELQKAVEQIRVETFSKSAELAQKNLSTQLTPDQQKAWNSTLQSRLNGVH